MFAAIDPSTHPYAALGLTRNPDGSITRAAEAPITPPSCNLTEPTDPVLSKDVPLNPSTNTSVRLFLPRTALDTATKLPLIIYVHGGGFVILRAASTIFHNLCTTVASETPALVVSVDYRLAPEHRLPTAYDDCMEALHWIKTTDDEWVTKYADLSNCYLMGTSAGGNIAYHVGLRAAVCAVDELGPVKVNGLILHQPFFGGVERTPSEIKLATDTILPLAVSDIMWELGLPLGADRDHEYSNPMTRPDVLDKIKDLGWRVIVTGCDGDSTVDRQMELAKALKEHGVKVLGKFIEGEYHGYDLLEPSKSELILGAVQEMVNSPNK
ncbi:hypothetical protein DH2020_046525 [Rehmannia glutinosa]|uniref:Alpha/beta hydrolase fold-3 domain-containing protein n=1 Tax=Rehmannia glutinosa TaxID=99300 RepID=A0ABR0UBC4_REHGL